MDSFRRYPVEMRFNSMRERLIRAVREKAISTVFQPVIDLIETYNNVTARNSLEAFHDAQERREDGISIDQIYASRFGQETPLPSIQLCIENLDSSGTCGYNYSCAYMDTISWANPTTGPAPTTGSPTPTTPSTSTSRPANTGNTP